VKVLPNVDTRGVDPRLHTWLLLLDMDHRTVTGEDLTITSLRRPAGARDSRHSPPADQLVDAADLRRRFLDDQGAAEEWCRTIQRHYGRWLGVVLEPEWLTEDEAEARGGRDHVQPHVHVQLKGGAWPNGR
jgi:hypothetical protein